jgi:hypothetical protein
MSENWCDYGKHEITQYGGYVIYSDEERGLDNVKMCKHCYALHVIKYFPDSHMKIYMINNPTEFHLTLEERGFK